MTLKIEVKGIENLQRALDQRRWRSIIANRMLKAAEIVRTTARTLVPVDTGTLRRSIHTTLHSAGGEITAQIGSNLPYAPFMEYGTGMLTSPPRSRHWPPGRALQGWAQRHGFRSGFHVARIIGIRGGLKPRRFMLRTLNMKRSQIWREITRILDDIKGLA